MNFFSEDPNKYQHALEDMRSGSYEEFPIEITEERLEELCHGSEQLEGLKDELMSYCCRYMTDVLKMQEQLMQGIDDEDAAEKYKEQDDARTRLHNTVIDSFNILSRALAKEGRDNSWMAPLVHTGGDIRAGYKRLALLLAYRHYLKMTREVQHEEGSGR